VKHAAERGTAAGDQTPRQRLATAGDRAVVGQRFRQTHADAGTERAGKPHKKRGRSAVGQFRCGKEWCQSRYRAVHESEQRGLYDLQHCPSLERCPAAQCLNHLFHRFLHALGAGYPVTRHVTDEA